MSNLILLILSFFTIISAQSVYAGGWVSSGGELFQMGKNPWFVKGSSGGTDQVYYCVEIDRTSISADEATVKSSIRAAFDYWKTEFANSGNLGQGFAPLATQAFNYQSQCDGSSDIRFLFGYATLKKDEVDFLEDPAKYVGVTVRTDYDQVNLKGRGFVYISGDQGDHPYHNSGDLIDRAWTNEKLLRYALIHEVGHIMGIPHTGVGLMSEVFPEQVINKRFSKFYLENSIQSFLNPPLDFKICNLNGSFNPTFFKLTSPATCLAISGKKGSNGDIEWDLASLETPTSSPKSIGTIRAQISGSSILGARPSVVIHLPQEQKVFSYQDRLLNGFMLGAPYQEGSAKGAFRATGSMEPFEVQVEMHPDSIHMVGVVDGRPMPVLVYNPPSLLNMLLPIDGVGP